MFQSQCVLYNCQENLYSPNIKTKSVVSFMENHY